MKALKITIVAFFISMILFYSCVDDNKENIVPRFLIEATPYESSVKFEYEVAKTFLNENGLSGLSDFATYDFKVYKITYKTAFEGDTIIASGVVALPIPLKKKDVFPVMSYQHPLLIQKSSAPSENIDTEAMVYLASTGMVVLIPDYIGYGASKDKFHPYLNKEYSSNTILDFIRASKEFILIQKPCEINEYLFLFGYAQGAGASLVALSDIENKTANNDLKVTATSCANGLYNLTDFRKWMVKQLAYDTPYLLAYMLESYTKYSGLDIDYSLVFSPKIGPKIEGIIDGTSDSDDINKIIGTTHVGEMLNDDYEVDSLFDQNEAYLSLRKAYTDNSIDAWSLKSVLALYYGTNDKMIPSDQSILITQNFQKIGLITNVKAKPLNGKDHETAFNPIVEETIRWFRSLSAE